MSNYYTSLNKKLAIFTFLFSLFIFIFFSLGAKTNAQSNDYVVTIGNKMSITIRSIGPSSTPVPSGFCTNDSQCNFDQKCTPPSGPCVIIECGTPPICKRYTINNHQCQLLNSADGSICYDTNNNLGACQNGNCLISSPTPQAPSPTGIILPSPTKTPTPTTLPSITPRPSLLPSATQIPILSPSKTPRPSPTAGSCACKKDKIELEPDDDASVDERRPDTNFDRRPILEIDGDFTKQAFMKFNISKLVGKQIISARLKLRVANFAHTVQNIRFVDDSNWSEKKITYNTRPAAGNIIGKIESSGQFGKWLSVDLDPDAISTEDKNLTIEIDSPGKLPFHLFSRDSNFKPQLVIDYIR